MKVQALTLQKLIELSNKDIWKHAKKRELGLRMINEKRKLTKKENIRYNRIKSIVKLYEKAFSDKKDL